MESRIRATRAERGWTVRRLAEESGVDKNTVSELERGVRNPNPLTMHKLARALGVEVSDLFPKDLDPSPTFGLSATAAPKVQEWLEERGATLVLMPDAEFRELVLSNTKAGDPVDGIERLVKELDAEDRAVDRALMDEWGQGGKLLPAVPPGPDEAELRFVQTREMTKLRRALADAYDRRRHGLWNYSKRLHAAGRSSSFLAHPKEARRLLEEAFAKVGAA